MLRFVALFMLLFLAACGGKSKEELFQEGNSLYEQGNFRGAIVLYKNALEKDPNYLEAREGLATTYLASNNLQKAENEYKKLLHQNPSDSDLLLKLATVYLQMNNAQAALLELDTYSAKNPESVESLTLYGRAHAAAGDYASARDMFIRALTLDPNANEARYYLSWLYLQRDETAQARTGFSEIIKRDPTFVRAYYALASLEARAGNIDESIAAYQSLLDASPEELQARYMIGMLQIDKGDLDAAQQTVDDFLAKHQNRAEGLRLKGLLHYRQGRYDEAVQALTESLKTQQHVLGYFFLGLSYYGQGQLELALNQFQKALDLKPDFDRARTLVALTLLKQSRIDDAITEISKVLRGEPENAYARNILGSAYLAKGDYEKGMEELEQATEIDPSLADAHIKRGLFRLAKGEAAAGEADLVKAVSAAPEVLNSRLMLVAHYFRQKNYSAAIELLNQGLDGSQQDALLNNYLAAAYFAQNKPGAAVAALGKAKSINPDYFKPYFNLAGYYTSEAEYDKALGEYSSVLQRDPNNLTALQGQAAVYGVQGDAVGVERVIAQIEATETEQGALIAAFYYLKQNKPEQAHSIVRKGVAAFPDSGRLLELDGAFYKRNGQLTEAEVAYQKLSGIDPESGSRLLYGLYLQSNQQAKADQLVKDLLRDHPAEDYPYLLSATMLLRQGQLEQAATTLQQSLAKVNQSNRMKLMLGTVFERSGDLFKAESTYRQILQESPRFAPAYLALGNLKERSGDKGAALDLYKKAIKHDRNNVVALNNAAYLLADNFGQGKDALGLAMAAYRLRPSDPRIMDTLGFVLLQNDRAGEALNLFRTATKLLPDVPTIRLHQAMAHKALGELDAARLLLEEIAAGGESAAAGQAAELLKSL